MPSPTTIHITSSLIDCGDVVEAHFVSRATALLSCVSVDNVMPHSVAVTTAQRAP